MAITGGGCSVENNFTLGSLFDGIGGFPLAAVLVGIKPIWASEIEEAPISITKRHFPEMKHLGDITKINGAEIEPVDIITFGSPCQDLSMAGNRAGLEGARSGLFMEAVRIIKEMRDATNGAKPKFAIWENVPGAFSSNNGADFQTVIEEIANIAEPGISIPRPPKKSNGGGAIWEYAGAVVGDSWTLAWRTMDAQYFGVPQRRKRIFLVADFRKERAGEILFKPDSLQRDIAESEETREGTSANTERCARVSGFNGWRSSTGTIEYEEERSPCINENMPPNVICAAFLPRNSANAKSIAYAEDLSPTLMTGQLPSVVHQNLTIDRHAVAFDPRNNTISEDISGTLQAKENGGHSLNYQNPILTDYIVRRLTPTECERLQGFPDGWTEYGEEKISDNKRYKALGNSVALPCILFIVERIKEALCK